MRIVGDTLLAPLQCCIFQEIKGIVVDSSSVDQEYKLIKAKMAIKLYENPDPMTRSLRILEERVCEKRFSSFVKDVHRFAKEWGTGLSLATRRSII